MGVSGDFGPLSDWQRRMSAQRMRALAPDLAKRIGAASLKLVADEFRSGRDPYGAAWLATKKGNPPLRRTGRMAGSATAQANGPTVKVTIGTTYAKYHQDGTRVHARKGGAIPVNRRGWFVSKRKLNEKAASQGVKVFGSYTHGGIPKRQMLPEAATGGLGPVWAAAFRNEERDLVMQVFGRA